MIPNASVTAKKDLVLFPLCCCIKNSKVSIASKAGYEYNNHVMEKAVVAGFQLKLSKK